MQALLDENRQGDKRKPRTTKASMLMGLHFDTEGTLYTPTHASKNGRGYRYYTSQAVIQKTVKIKVPARIPAPDLEAAVTEQILGLLRNPEALISTLRDDVLDSSSIPAGFYTRIITNAAAFEANWQSRSLDALLAGIPTQWLIAQSVYA